MLISYTNFDLRVNIDFLWLLLYQALSFSVFRLSLSFYSVLYNISFVVLVKFIWFVLWKNEAKDQQPSRARVQLSL